MFQQPLSYRRGYTSLCQQRSEGFPQIVELQIWQIYGSPDSLPLLWAESVIEKTFLSFRKCGYMIRQFRDDRFGEGMSSGGLIRLKKGLTSAEELSVLAHEVAHEIMHRDRNNMSKDKKVRETEAEAVAFVVCQGIGLDTNSSSSDYIQLYNGNKETLMESLGRIQKTASEILESVMEKESEGETAGEKSCIAVAA